MTEVIIYTSKHSIYRKKKHLSNMKSVQIAMLSMYSSHTVLSWESNSINKSFCKTWSADIITVINTIIVVQISWWRHSWRGAEVGEEQSPHNTQLAA